MRDATSPLEAAVVAKIEDPLSNADPVETLNIEMDLRLLLEQCFKSTENFNEVMLRLENFFEICTRNVNFIQSLRSSGNVIDRVYQADLPEATSTDEQCLISPLCNDHCPLVTPIITEIREESILQYFCGFSERATIFCATYVFRSQSLASVRTIYITLPRSPQIVFPTKLKSMVEFNRLSVTAPSGTEQSHRWKEGAKKPWILPNKVSKLLQSNRSIGNFRLKNRLTNMLSKFVTPRRGSNSELTGDCEKLNFDTDFPLDALAESEYIQFVEADLDSSIYWYANAGTSVGCLEQKSKTSDISGRGSIEKPSLRRHKVEKFKRRWKNGTPFSVTDTDSVLLNNKEIDFKVSSPLRKLGEVSCLNQDINENNGCAQLVEVDAQARDGSHIKFDQKMVTPANPMPRSGCSFSQEDVTRACKSCSTWGYRKRLEASSNIHLLKADVRMPSLLQNTANSAKRQIRMPEEMKHGRRMYSTPNDKSGETRAE
ncbi:hypothetical protein TSMEX_006520 [Taenia solium]|eukprot:TsM_000438500 transcript=TsM_000438500 gene=TsM_000438500